MHLWTEYEGRTIAGAYTLSKLLRSEGRNGFFATADPAGNAAVIRLTEAHFDEEEVLKRWRRVAELHGHHLIAIERVGQTTVEGVALTYALMEGSDANLEDVLSERPLTSAETLEVAKAVLAALGTLHATGLVHEHIEPANVLAVGEVVKLRSDCVRECVADGEFTSEEACVELRKQDVHDFGTLLLRCLTLERDLTPGAIPGAALAEPFNRIVPGAIKGNLSLREIEEILHPAATPPAETAETAGIEGTTPSYHVASAVAPVVVPAIAPASASNGHSGTNGAARAPLIPNGVRPSAISAPASTVVASPDVAPPMATEPRSAGAATAMPVHGESALPMRAGPAWETEAPSRSAFKPIWLLGAVAALAVLWLLWHLVSGKPAATSVTPATSTTAAPAAGPAAGAAPALMGKPTSPGAKAAVPAASGPAAHRAGWYVVAYTYNRQDQARTKAARVERRHAGFHPQIFSPSGHAPFFVSLGGPMTEGEANAVWRRARRSGLPRDTFVRRY